MGFVVRAGPEDIARASGDPWDWGSFLWGIAAGGVFVTLLGGVVLYFAWPYVMAAMRAVPLFREAVEEARARGLL